MYYIRIVRDSLNQIEAQAKVLAGTIRYDWYDTIHHKFGQDIEYMMIDRYVNT
jgi:hypothetical protein